MQKLGLTLVAAVLLSSLVTLAQASAVEAPAGHRPNVVFVVLDDLGFADLGSYGSEIRTPNLDRLARGGLRYTGFHVTPLCSPSRAALLTGRNPHTVGVRTITNYATEAENNRGRITPQAATLAEILRDGGYATFALGKWHVAPMYESSASGPFENWPLGKGFDRYYGFLDGGTDQFRPELVSDNHWIDLPRRPGYHLSADLVDKSIGFLQDHQSLRPEKPFFLYLAFGAAHAPHQAPEEFIRRYRGRYDRGWDEVRAQRFARMKELGIAPASARLASRNAGVRPWAELSPEERRVSARFQEAYAGFVEHTDTQVGRLLAFLERIDRLDDTMIVVLSDNGASPEGGLDGTANILRGVNGLNTDLRFNLAHFDEIGGPRTEVNYPHGWAQVSNTPFARYKQTVHAGGVRVPLIVHWPAGIANQGGIRSQFHDVVDLAPTVLDLAGLKTPDVYRGVPQLPMAGVSLAYTFSDASAASRRSTQYFELFGHRAIYHQGWKAVAFHKKGQPFAEDPWDLYDLTEDFSEVHDVAAQHPEKVKELQQLWLAEAGRFGALPLDERTFELRAVFKPGAPQNRTRFVYLPGMTYLTTAATPNTKDRSYTITASVERRSADDDGVLIAYGGVTSGYVLYIKNNRLVHEYNAAGTFYSLASEGELPTGAAELRFEFEKTGSLQGLGRLYVNGKLVGEATIPRTLGTMISFEGLDIGRDSYTPVTWSYEDRGEFPFAGALKSVVVELGPDQASPR